MKKLDIEISDKLKDVLLEIESESQVARLLLGKESGEIIDNPINYISISEQDKTKVSYLTTDRIKKFQESSIDPSLIWTSSIRFHGRPGSIITKIFKNITPKEIEKFTNLYRSSICNPKYTFNVVSGDKIKDYYHYSSYAKEACEGSLGNSCMKHDSCQKFLDIYNNEMITMLSMINDDGELMGRALLWDIGEYKIMDRIYTIFDEELLFHFKKWATDNGYLYKSEQNWNNTLYFESLNIKKQSIKLDIKLADIDYKYYPYFDTFKWLDFEKGTIHNYIPDVSDKSNIKTLCSSDGGKLEWDHIILDQLDNIYRYKNECQYIKYLNIWTHQSNINYSDINESWILSKDADYNEDISDYVFCKEYDNLNNTLKIEELSKIILERRNRELDRKSTISQISRDILNGSGLSEMDVNSILDCIGGNFGESYTDINY